MTQNRDQQRFVALGAYFHPLEAAAIAARLEDEGIPTRVVGDEIATTLSYFGPAVGGAQVLVPESAAMRAAAILEQAKTAEPDGEEPFPEGFDFGDATQAAEDESDAQKIAEADRDSGGDSTEQPRPGSTEGRVRRAYYAAVFSLVFFPLIMNLYSLLLLLSSDLSQASAKTRTRYDRALGINVMVVLAWGLFLVYYFYPIESFYEPNWNGIYGSRS